MIEVSQLVEPPKVIPPSRPVANETITRETIKANIDKVVSDVLSPIRFGDYHLHLSLFEMKANELSKVVDQTAKQAGVWNPSSEVSRGVIEPDRGQEILFELMREYGLVEDVHRSKDDIPEPFSFTDDTQPVWLENVDYPSQTIPGLTFRRTMKYVLTTGDGVSVSWSVLDEAPKYRFDLKRVAMVVRDFTLRLKIIGQ